jgi:hypothetical protein
MNEVTKMVASGQKHEWDYLPVCRIGRYPVRDVLYWGGKSIFGANKLKG